MAKKQSEIKQIQNKKNNVKVSKVLLVTGCIITVVGMVTTILALTLPYWVYLSETMETTVAGLTDDTEVEYYYGLTKLCLTMTATHLNRDDCKIRDWKDLKDWEMVTFSTLSVASALLLITVLSVLANLLWRNKLWLLIVAVVTSILAGVCSAVGVSVYQVKSSVLELDIDGLTTANFKPGYFSHAFWLGFSGSAASTLASIVLLLGTFYWKSPKPVRQLYPIRYNTAVRRQHCPYRGRTPATVSVTHV